MKNSKRIWKKAFVLTLVGGLAFLAGKLRDFSNPHRS
jgi:hypothetical protein